MMRDQLSSSIRLLVTFTLLTGIVYPATVTGVAQALFPRQAHGGLVAQGGRIVGSEQIGQRFVSDRYFHGRPSAAGADGYDARASSGSNLGPTSAKLVARVARDVERFRRQAEGTVPADAATASASGLDPHVSPATARAQAARVARARGLQEDHVRELIAKNTEDRALGIVGEPRINVLRLNLALDALDTRR